MANLCLLFLLPLWGIWTYIAWYCRIMQCVYFELSVSLLLLIKRRFYPLPYCTFAVYLINGTLCSTAGTPHPTTMYTVCAYSMLEFRVMYDVRYMYVWVLVILYNLSCWICFVLWKCWKRRIKKKEKYWFYDPLESHTIGLKFADWWF